MPSLIKPPVERLASTVALHCFDTTATVVPPDLRNQLFLSLWNGAPHTTTVVNKLGRIPYVGWGQTWYEIAILASEALDEQST